MDDPLLLGIDFGTTNCKAIVFDRTGRLIASASAPTPTYHPRPEWTEHDPEALWQAVAGTLRSVLAGIDPERVRGLSVASVGEAGTLIDVQGRVLCPMIAWHDGRTLPELCRWREQFDQRRASSITCLPAKPICTLFKLQWLRDHKPEAYQRAARWLLAADYIAFRLSGEQATDYSLASRTLLFDLRGRCWSDEIVEAAGLRRDLLPDLRPAGAPLGVVSRNAAEQTGLAPGTVVAIGGHDHIVGALAAGVVRGGQCLDSLGTAEAAFLPLDADPPEDATYQSGCAFGAHVARDRIFLLEGLLSGGASVGWARSVLTPGEGDFTRLEQLAASAPPGSRGALFLPRLVAAERGAFAGLNLATGPAELARAVYEGLAFGWRQLLERSEATAGVYAESIRVIGGGVHSEIWTTIKADVLGRPLRVLSIEESVALGAAMLGGLAARVYHNEEEALASVQLEERLVLPDQERAALYDQFYHTRFIHLMPALAEIHAATVSEQ